MVVIAPKEPLLVSQDVLDAALAIIRDICARHGFEPRVEVGVERDPEIPGPPIQLLTVFVPELEGDAIRRCSEIALEVARGLRSGGIKTPSIPLDAFVIPGW